MESNYNSTFENNSEAREQQVNGLKNENLILPESSENLDGNFNQMENDDVDQNDSNLEVADNTNLMLDFMQTQIDNDFHAYHSSQWNAEIQNVLLQFVDRHRVIFLWVDDNRLMYSLDSFPAINQNAPEAQFNLFMIFKADVSIAIDASNIADMIKTKSITINRGLNNLIDEISSVVLSTLVRDRSWPENIRKDLLMWTYKFLCNLTEIRSQREGKIILYIPNENLTPYLLNWNPSSQEHKDVCARLECVLTHWVKQIKDMLSNQTNQSDNDNSDLIEEVNFWSKCKENLVYLRSQLEDKRIAQVLELLSLGNSNYISTFESLSDSIVKGARQAEDNLGFLRVLEEPCRQIDVLPADSIPQVLQNVFFGIRMLWENCSYYSSEEKVAGLFRKVSNQIIKRCSATIDLDELFAGNVETCLTALDDSIRCLKNWKEVYEKNTSLMKKSNCWRFESDAIFAQIEAFIQRCLDLKEICEGQIQFARKGVNTQMPIFSGSKGTEIFTVLDEIKESFEKQLFRLSGSNKERILDIKSSKWHEEYNIFKAGIKNLDNMYINLITLAFDNVFTVDQAIEYLVGFRVIARRDPIALHVLKKIERVNELFLRELQNSENLAKMPPNPQLYKGKYSARALWHSGLLQRLHSFKSLYDKLYFVDANYKEQIEVEYLRIENNLKMSITNAFKEFKENNKDLEATLSKRLDQNILIESTSKFNNGNQTHKSDKSSSISHNLIECNFDKKLLAFIIELENFKKLSNQGIPSFGGKLEEFLDTQKEKLRIYRENVMLVVRDYNNIIKELNVFEEELFREHIDNINSSIFRGLKILRWSSQGTLDNFVKECRSKCEQVDSRIAQFKRIESSVEEMIKHTFSKIRFFHFDARRVLEYEQFKSLQGQTWQMAKREILELFQNIENSLAEIYMHFIEKGESVQKAWFGFVCKIDKLIEDEFRKHFKANYQELLKAITGDEKSKTNPTQIFKVFIVHKKNDKNEDIMDFEPPIGNFHDLIGQLLSHSIMSFSDVQRLPYIMLDARNKKIKAIQESFQNENSQLKGNVPNNAQKKYQGNFVEISKAWLEDINGYYILSIQEEVAHLHAEILRQLKSQTSKLNTQLEPWKKCMLSMYEHNEQSAYSDYILWNNAGVASLRTVVEYYDTVQSEIQVEKSSDDTVCIQVDTNRIKRKLIDLNYEEQKTLLGKIKDKGIEGLRYLNKTFMENEKLLSVPPTDLQSIKQSIELWETLYNQKKSIEESLGPLEEKFKLLDDYMIVFKDDETRLRYSIRDTFERFYNVLESVKKRNDSYYVAFQNDHMKRLQDFEQEVRDIRAKMLRELPIKVESGLTCDRACNRINTFRNYLKEIRENERKMEFGFDLFKIFYVPVPEIALIEQDIENLQMFWNLRQQWDDQIKAEQDIQFYDINTEKIIELCKGVRQNIYSLPKVVQSYEVCESLVSTVEKYSQTMQLIDLLKVDFLRERHWKVIRENVKENFEVTDKSFCLRRVFEMNLENIAEVIKEVNETARAEFKIEGMLADISARWEKEEMQFEQLKFSGIKIVSSVYADKLAEYLEEDLIQLSSLKSNIFAAPFAKEVENWDNELNRVSEILDLLMLVQKKFVYFNNIFSNLSEDIGQLIGDKNIFNNVRINLLGYLNRFEVEKNTRKNLLTRNFKEMLTELCQQLETIQKHMKKYLEKRKCETPRFYFLSDEDIFEILGKAKDPNCLRRFLKKMFEGISMIDHHTVPSAKGKIFEYVAIVSAEKERLDLLGRIEVNGDLNYMIQAIEKEMIDKLKNSLFDGLSSLPAVFASTSKGTEKLEKWLADTPGQIGLLCSEIDWTARCYQALLGNAIEDKAAKQNKKTAPPKDSWASVKAHYVRQMNDLILIIRKTNDELLKKKLIALITVEVHHKDLLETLSSCSTASFEWLSQLRYYRVEEGSERVNVLVEQGSGRFDYGFEYQGNNGRLVITPLTDRCYLTLTNAMHFKRGGNPQGPAGTGKTETVKDLGKNLGRFVFVFNCSEGLDSKNMKNMFEGFAQTGFWGCFDEFNRIEVEVLSVIAIQINTILEAIAVGKKVFDFEEKEIPLNKNCALFVTMNPGYLGRSELPDNLKALFRPISMIVPDSVQICRIALQAEGFRTADYLSKKIEALYSLMKQTLSRQSHYDFGLRAMKTVFSMAGDLRRQMNKENDPHARKENESFAEQKMLIQAIYTSNEPKLVSSDLPLFEGLLTDLFPDKGLNARMMEQEAFIKSIDTVMDKMNLDKLGYFVEKLSQVSHTKNSRHGNILIGKSMSGKSTMLKVLEEVQNKMGSKTRTFILNPKVLSVSELYGFYNYQTDESQLGVFSSIMDQLCNHDELNDEKWIIFDGPIDTKWIESMNSLLDDNKVLTLLDGNRINLKDGVKLFFEVDELSQASPATVSRCGMIFIDEKELGPSSIRTAWILQKDAVKYNDLVLDFFDDLFDKWAEPLLTKKRSIRHYEVVAISENAQMRNLCQLFDTFLSKLHCDFSKVTTQESEELFPVIEKLFVFCVIWTIGANLNPHGRVIFDNSLRDIEAILPFAQTIYDYYPSIEKGKFSLWEEKLTIQPHQWKPPQNASPHEFVVETVDTARIRLLVTTLIEENHNVLGVGPSGVGKTAFFKAVLRNLDEAIFSFNVLNLTAGTSSLRLQESIEAKLNRTTKKKLRPFSGKRGVVFVDDLALPKKDEFGYQPTLELLRQEIEYSGWYDRASLDLFLQVKDIQFITAMREGQQIPERLLNRFHVLGIAQPADAQLRRIYSSILYYNFADFDGEEVKSEIENCVSFITSVFKDIVSDESLINTPSKPHYLFSLKDVTRIVQGISVIERSNCDSKMVLLKLLYHEHIRVYQDKMVTSEDKATVARTMETNFDGIFDKKLSEILNEPNGPIFVSFLDFNSAYHLVTPKENIDSVQVLREVLETNLTAYNREKKQPLPIVLFNEAIHQIVKISRVFNIEKGNLLLIGEGGTGRHSLTKLSAFVNNMALYEIKTRSALAFRNQIKLIFEAVVNKPEKFVLLFGENEVNSAEVLEEINALLSVGEIPNLFTKKDGRDEFSKIKDKLMAENKKDNEEAAYEYFLQFIGQRMHIVFCANRTGDNLRLLTRNYSGLVYGTTQIFFENWSENALRQVAEKFLRNHSEEIGDAIALDLPEFFAQTHIDVSSAALQMSQQTGRFFQVTPKSFVDFGKCFEQILMKKTQEINKSILKYQNGLQKLADTKKSVEELKTSMDIKRVELHKKKKECEEMIFKIDVEKREAAKEKKNIEEKEEFLSNERIETMAMAEAAEAQLLKAMPALMEANEKVQTLDNTSMAEIKVLLKTKDKRLELIMFSLMVLLGEKPKWDNVQKVVTSPSFVSRIHEIDKDKIDEERVRKLEQYTQQPEMQTNLELFSRAVNTLAVFIRAIEVYSKINIDVTPIKLNVKKLKNELAIKEEELANLKKNLASTLERLASLNQVYDTLNAEYNIFLRDFSLLEQRLERAEKLVFGLESSQESWVNYLKYFNDFKEKMLGNVLLSAAFLNYFGPFSIDYREKLMNQNMIPILKRKKISISNDFKTVEFLSSEVELLNWNFNGLPYDQASLQSAVIVSRAVNWPYIIDPQNQCLNWLKSIEQDNKLLVLDCIPPKLPQILERAVIEGMTVIYEHNGEEINAAFEPVLARITKKLGETKCIMVYGDKEILMHPSFKFFITTKQTHFNLKPEIATKVTLVNFTVIQAGLEDQLLSYIIKILDEKLEAQRIESIKTKSQCDYTLRELEDRILDMLQSDSEVPLVDSIELIETLQTSREKEEEIRSTLEVTKLNFKKIMASRENYRYLGYVASLLYFAISQFDRINYVYQFSLDSFIREFESILVKVRDNKNDFADTLIEKIRKIDLMLRKRIYKLCSESLFEKDRALMSFVLAITLAPIDAKAQSASKAEEARKKFQFESRLSSENIDQEQLKVKYYEEEFMNEVQFFFRPPISGTRENFEQNPDPSWITHATWEAIHDLNALPCFQGLLGSFLHNTKEWKKLFISPIPEKEVLPSDWSQKIKGFSFLLLIKTIRIDRLIFAINEFVKSTLGSTFVTPHSFNLEKVVKRVNKKKKIQPILILVGSNVDPWSYIDQLATKHNRIVSQVSLGQGQLDRAKGKIIKGMQEGFWVYLGNIHLSMTFLKEIDLILDLLKNGSRHPNFQLFLSAKPQNNLPLSLLQNSAKIVLESVKGIKANLSKIIGNLLPDFKPTDEREALIEFVSYRKLVFALAWLHSIVNERKRFRSLGWNVNYEFPDTDFVYSEKMIHEFIGNQKSSDNGLQWDSLRYLLSQINYGGRITDPSDQRLLNELVREIFTDELLTSKNFMLGDPNDSSFKVPSDLDENIAILKTKNSASINNLFGNLRSDLMDYIKGFPEEEPPQIFGQHINAEITMRIEDSKRLIDILGPLTQNTKTSSSGLQNNGENELVHVINELITKLPPKIQLSADNLNKPSLVANDGSTQLADPFKTFFFQEAAKYNEIIDTILSDLSTSQSCLHGKLIPTEEIEAIMFSLNFYKVPKKWRDFYLSSKTLFPWLEDLNSRVQQIQEWMVKESLTKYWIGGFIYPNGFMTALLQSSARKNATAVDNLKWEFQFMPQDANLISAPKEGAYVTGLYLEGGKWDFSTNQLVEADPMNLYYALPPIIFKPVEKSSKTNQKGLTYNCPCYVYPIREGSVERPSFVCSITVPYGGAEGLTEAFWIKRGTAILLSLDN